MKKTKTLVYLEAKKNFAVKKLTSYNEYFHTHFYYRNSNRLTRFFMYFTYLIFLTLLFSSVLLCFKTKLTKPQIMTDIISSLPFSDNLVTLSIILFVCTFLVPLFVGLAFNKLSNKSIVNASIPKINYNDALSIAKDLKNQYYFNPYNLGNFSYIGLLIGFGIGVIGGFLFIPFVIAAAIIAALFKKLINVISEIPQSFKLSVELCDFIKELTEIENALVDEENRIKAAENRAKKALEKKLKELEKKQRRDNAEAEFLKLMEQGNEDYDTIKNLANDKSPSACLYIGRAMYQEWLTEPLTINEKEDLANKIEDYLKIPAKENNTEAKFLLLSIDVSMNGHNIDDWERLLKEARAIKRSGSLPENFMPACDILIKSIVDVIDNLNSSSTLSHKSSTSYSSPSYSAPPPKPDKTFCWHWDLGCSKDGGDCNGWCKDFYSHVDSVQKQHEAYLRYYNSL